MSHSPESVRSPRPSLPYSPLAFGLARSPVVSDSDSTPPDSPPQPEIEVISVLSPAVMAAHEDIAAQLEYIRTQTEALNRMFEAQNIPNRVFIVDPTTMPQQPPPPVPPPAPPAPPAPVIVEQKSKANVLDVYTGDCDKAKPFICQLWLYFEARGPEFPSAKRKVIFALSYMRASPWANNVIDKIHDDDDMDRQFRFQTFSEFTATFMEHFGERDENAAAHHRMTHLEQGSMTIDELIAKFEELEYL